jgi:hypothetical protein
MLKFIEKMTPKMMLKIDVIIIKIYSHITIFLKKIFY